MILTAIIINILLKIPIPSLQCEPMTVTAATLLLIMVSN